MAEEDTVTQSELTAQANYPLDLLPALGRLDLLLARAVEVAQSIYGAQTATDRFRGLYVSPEDAVNLLTRAPGLPTFGPEVIGDHKIAITDEDSAAGATTQHPTDGPLSFLGRLFRSRSQPDKHHKNANGDANGEDNAVGKGPATAPPAAAGSIKPAEPSRRMTWLQHAYGLTPFDLDVILIALAPEIDLRYERLYAYLQDNVSRRRPSVDLVLNLLCTTAEAKISRRAHFSPDGPLLRHRLIRLISDREGAESPLLANYLQVDGQIVRLLLHQQTLDPRLVAFSQLYIPEIPLVDAALPDEITQMLTDTAAEAWLGHRALRVYLHGPQVAQARQAAESVAALIGAPLLAIDLAGALDADPHFAWVPDLIFREAWFHNALIFLDNMDPVLVEERREAFEQLADVLSKDGAVFMAAGTRSWQQSQQAIIGMLSVPVPLPGFQQRKQAWKASLAAAGASLADEEMALLAGRFRLSPHQIAEAAATALNQARWREAAVESETDELADPQPTLAEFFAAARAQTGHELASLSTKIEPVYRWDDIVIPDDTRAQLLEICQRVDYQHYVLEDWGFERKISLGKGVNALFVGPSGTGKTMAAEIIANRLGLDLYKIDLSSVVSKYIGETEKNLDRIFSAAENANAILFFDEADALFGKRSEVRDSHDRYANIEISYLLQKMEEHNGITILATNLRQNLDEAFVRRLAFTVHFPFPDEESRHRIWEGIWPQDEILADGVDLAFMARRFQLAGGNIKNIALAGAFLAAADDSPVTLDHLLHATRREYQKMGKVLSADELRPTETWSVQPALVT